MIRASNKNRRLIIVACTLAVITVYLIIRYGIIMLKPTASPEQIPANILSNRGPIFDRHGRVLAIQTHLDTVTAWKPAIQDIEETASILSEILDINTQAIRETFSTTNDYVILQRTITPTQSQRIKAVQETGQLSGIHLESDMGRSYPERDAAAAVIGYVGVDNVGLSGIEYMFSHELTPPSDNSVGKTGNQVFLTLDLAIQALSDEIAQQAFREYEADNVIIIVSDAKTGDLLAVSDIPSFDTNNFMHYTDEERRNRVITKIYEPGSVFKIFSVASFLELGGIEKDTRFDTAGGYITNDQETRITDLGEHGVINTQQIIQYSSNVGAAYASETVSAGGFYTLLTLFGFGTRTGVDMNGEEHGLLSPPDRWSPRSKPTIAIGQEIGVTAMQIVAAATVFANDGILLRPQIIHRILTSDGSLLRKFGREPVHEVLSPQVSRAILAFMQSSTQGNGTARRIQISGINIAAKTGTAEVFNPEIRTYSEEHFIASTLALFPVQNPQLIVYALIDHPKTGEFLGGRIAAPIVGELIDFLIPYMDIHSTNDSQYHAQYTSQQPPPLPKLETVVPNYTGFSKRALLPLLAREDIQVIINGNGWVTTQSPSPGTRVTEGMTLSLQLR